MGVRLNKDGFGACPDYNKYIELGLPKYPTDIKVEKSKITLTLREPGLEGTIYLDKICSCSYSHFINDERVYQTDLHEQLLNIREAMGDEALTTWLRERCEPKHPSNYADDLDEVCQMGSAFFFEEGLKISMSMEAKLTIVTLE